METRKKKTLMLVAISLFSIAIVSFGTYALWNSELLTGNNSITTGQVKMSYTETNEIETPKEDEQEETKEFDKNVLKEIKSDLVKINI